ncbi:ChaN family lipoprotein [Dichotomicrobium thermohalophilum]|uniref:Putative iron-regulated protein n=1 Tax=Dichotomicrobium thermohalophilum TaxID=933063 RepID=A0A397Q1W3_9HYPH|nr:ChaN family lipoprotein [Dichotomicrobium thermohalophilum]RIA55480.1 putative iron-regulated protein [Dichotomicrobium thermohalophilum]
MLRSFLAVLALTWAMATPMQAAEPWTDWQAPIHADSEMAGTVWDARAGATIDPAELIDRLAQARFVLIGEIHDNPDHHRLQGWIIARLAMAGASPAVVMEMISRDKAEALSAYLAQPEPTAAGLGPALNWGESGWPEWQFYQPIAEAAFAAGLPIGPGNPPSNLTRQTAEQGFDSLGKARKAELALDEPLSPALSDALMDELYEGHCQMLSREKLAPMAKVQRLRDAFMAEGMLTAERETALLIAGNGHVRADRGVPWYLRRRAPESDVAVVALVELDGERAAPRDYVETGPDGTPIADFFWLTPRAERPDPCEQMRQMMQQQSGGN